MCEDNRECGCREETKCSKCDGSIPAEEIIGILDDKEIPLPLNVQRVLPRLNKEDGTKLGRNDPCPCKSSKKFKHCCWKEIN